MSGISISETLTWRAPAAPSVTGFDGSTGHLFGTAAPGLTIKATQGVQVLASTAAAVLTGAWNLDLSAIGEGPHRLTLRASTAGGRVSDPVAAFVQRQALAGHVTILGFDGVGLFGSAPAGAQLTLTRGVLQLAMGQADPLTGAFELATGRLIGGPQVVSVTALDAHGRSATASLTLTGSSANPDAVELSPAFAAID